MALALLNGSGRAALRAIRQRHWDEIAFSVNGKKHSFP
jgi:hypothetical protein